MVLFKDMSFPSEEAVAISTLLSFFEVKQPLQGKGGGREGVENGICFWRVGANSEE